MKKISILLTTIFVVQLSLFSQKLDRSIIPQPGPAPVINIKNPVTFTLNNGLKVFVVENHKLPLISLQLIIDNDPFLEKDKAGTADFSGQLLMRGTVNRKKEDIDKEIDFIGAQLETYSDGFYASTLSKHLEKLMDVLSDIILHPSFPETELEKIRKQKLSSLANEKNDPDAISYKVKKVLLYGKNHPYGEIETEETIKNITIEDCKKYYKTYYRPNNAYLAIVGDITVEKAKEIINKYFSQWEKGNVPSHDFPIPKAPVKRKVSVINKEGAVQSVINVAYPIELKPGLESLKASVMNTILGGGASSRLFMNLREDKAFTYGAYSSIKSDPIVGEFDAFLKARNIVTDSSVTEVLKEMSRIRKEKVSNEELKMAKNYKTGTFAMALEDPKTIARFAINVERYHLEPDFYKNYLKNIEKLSSEDILQMAQKYILPENSHIIIVGNADEVSSKLKKFSPENKIYFYDNEGNPVEKNKKPLPEGLTAKNVINKYLESIGGYKNLKKVKTLTQTITANVQNMQINGKKYIKYPDKYFFEMKMGEMLISKQILNGNKGKTYSMQGTKELNDKEKEELKIETRIFPELYFDELNIKTNLTGIEKINGKDAYKIEVIYPDNDKIIMYFDTKTGLKIRELNTQDTPQGTITQITDLSDYKEVKNVKFPTKISQTVGPQTFNFEIKQTKVNDKISDDTFNIE